MKTAKSSAYPEDRLAALLLDKCGFADIQQTIVDQIEDDISGQYDAIDEEEGDGSTPSYGGLVYTSFMLVEDGKLNYIAQRRLTTEQKKILLMISDEGELEISVCRNDYFTHDYSFPISVPKVPNKPEGERFFLYVDMKFSINNLKDCELDVSYSEDMTPADLDKYLVLYSLAFS